MATKSNDLTRRDFLKTASAAGAGTVLTTSALCAEGKPPMVGKRPLGKTGIDVPILSLGGMFDIANNQLMLRKCYDWGVRCIDTAAGYQESSEKGIGAYFGKFPERRKEFFIESKASGAKSVDDMTSLLDRSLERMQTDYVDLYFMHGLSNVGKDVDLEAEKAWAEQAKKSGKIKLFGFSTHTNMESCLLAASKLGWIDAIMTVYNYRLMHTDAMKKAVDAAVAAGIGLIAMKTVGRGQIKEHPEDAKLLRHFRERGFNDYQGKIRAVWANEQISTVCAQMPNMAQLKQNVAAALDRTELTVADWQALERHARNTCTRYCAGCGEICERALGGAVPVSNVMRYLMYANGYGDTERGRNDFRALPQSVRTRLSQMDFAQAEAACPHNLPIGELMAEATRTLA